MQKFARDLAEFLRRYYPASTQDGAYRFSADIEIRNGEVTVEIPMLSRMPDAEIHFPKTKIKTGPLDMFVPPEDAA
jgi:hypothetical protein